VWNHTVTGLPLGEAKIFLFAVGRVKNFPMLSVIKLSSVESIKKSNLLFPAATRAFLIAGCNCHILLIWMHYSTEWKITSTTQGSPSLKHNLWIGTQGTGGLYCKNKSKLKSVLWIRMSLTGRWMAPG